MELLITSSVLIAALLVLRRLFRNTISRQMQYALWGLVLIRLLVPVSLPNLSVSVLNAEPQAQAAVTKSMAREVYILPIDRAPAARYPMVEQTKPGGVVPGPESFGYPVLSEDGKTVTKYARRVSRGEVLNLVWKAGVVLMAGFFLITNLRFWRKLRKNRVSYEVEGAKRPVYLCKGLPSPCLFGTAIYLTPAAVASPERQRYVLAHEETHARHWDPLWSLLRCVCLTVYWFHPLVWVAAMASKADCELACDEGALKRLGDGERIAYGQTLLALIPVRRGAENPLLSTTSMTSGKRQLKGRITRIAKDHKPVVAAVFALAVLVLIVGACTFTGAKRGEGKRTLEGSELRYFNEEFFNGEDFNIRNQFLTSRYEKPEGINLHQLFYDGIPAAEGGPADGVTLRDEELRLAYHGNLPDTPSYKLTTAQMDGLLKKYTGLTLAETDGVGKARFTYLKQYDAYYWAHDDTNHYAPVSFTAGERDGDTVRLYYDSGGRLGSQWMALTLREKDGSYQFVSHMSAERPNLLPAGKPEVTVPLNGLAPYAAPAVLMERRVLETWEGREQWALDEKSIIAACRCPDGNTYVGKLYNDGADKPDLGIFLTVPTEAWTPRVDIDSGSMDYYSGLFGHEGLVISYSAWRSETNYGTVHDYYYLDEAGNPALLLRAFNDFEKPIRIDLDGDGEDELVAGNSLFFLRNGRVYEAPLPELVQKNWPKMADGGFSNLTVMPYGRYLAVRCAVKKPGWTDGVADVRRSLYFDGKSLFLYQGPGTKGHVLEEVIAPADVLAAAKAGGEAIFADAQAQKISLPDRRFDDWRIVSLDRLDVRKDLAPWPKLEVEVYQFGIELHATEPEKIGYAGGSYRDEDGWYGGFWPSRSNYLVFVVQLGERKLIESDIPVDAGPGSVHFARSLEESLKKSGMLPATDARAGQQAKALLDRIAAGDRVALTLTTADGVAHRYEVPPDFGNGPNRLNYIELAFDWGYRDGPMRLDDRESIKVESPDGALSLQCWQGTDEVRAHMDGTAYSLFAGMREADVAGDGSIYHYFRFWFDEAELDALQSGIVIPDRGQSRDEIAKSWAEAYEGARLKTLPGGGFTCTYVRVSASEYKDYPAEAYPERMMQTEHFAFTYGLVAVPENPIARSRIWAGNTEEHKGADAPPGAMGYGRIGYLYLSPDGWRCDGVGTG